MHGAWKGHCPNWGALCWEQNFSNVLSHATPAFAASGGRDKRRNPHRACCERFGICTRRAQGPPTPHGRVGSRSVLAGITPTIGLRRSLGLPYRAATKKRAVEEWFVHAEVHFNAVVRPLHDRHG
jgi:hypothetical protein